jgi:hypothetical protein
MIAGKTQACLLAVDILGVLSILCLAMFDSGHAVVM